MHNRLDKWCSNLLDLSSRNQLLNLKKNNAIYFNCSNLSGLLSQLESGKYIYIIPTLESTDNYEQQILNCEAILSELDEIELDNKICKLNKKCKEYMNETGTNNLFLAIGFIEWKEKEDSKKCLAPLVLVPIRLNFKSTKINTDISLSSLEDEPRFNQALLERFKKDFRIEIKSLESELPKQENGTIDINEILNIMSDTFEGKDNFKIIPDIAIAQFSFSKYIMWKEIKDNYEKLMQNKLVRDLIGGKVSDNENINFDTFDVRTLDKNVNANELFLPLPADSSQIVAILESAQGRSFVLDGPPGCGKSQTIVNMIAHNLAIGKRILFVSEKKAALDVVYRRLQDKGLGDFCLELHSNKGNKNEFLNSLRCAWETRENSSVQDWKKEAALTQSLREKLNEFVKVLHQPNPNGYTLYQAMGYAINNDFINKQPLLPWPNGTMHTVEEVEAFYNIINRVERAYEDVSQYEAKFNFIRRTEWSNNWQEKVVKSAENINKLIDEFSSLADALKKQTKVIIKLDNLEEIKFIIQILKELSLTGKLDYKFIFQGSLSENIEILKEATDILGMIKKEEKRLSVNYDDRSWIQVDVDELEMRIEEADKKWLFLSKLTRKKIIKEYVSEYKLSGTVNIDNDIDLIKKLQSLENKLSRYEVLKKIPEWKGLDTDYIHLKSIIEFGEKISKIIVQLVDPNITKFILENDVFYDYYFANSLFQKLEFIITNFEHEKKEFNSLVNINDRDIDVSTLNNYVEQVIEHRVKLKYWIDWIRLCNEVSNAGLVDVIREIYSQKSEKSACKLFEAYYCRWFASWMIDMYPVISQFVSKEHMDDIRKYRNSIERLSELSVSYIRAKLCEKIPSYHDGSLQGGFSYLKRELQKKRHQSIRQMFENIGDAIPKLAPCMLMSPLSVAQYLPVDSSLFDLVIFDEASQIPPWEALGALARGKQFVIVGDPRQMPPTDFFNSSLNDEEDEDYEDMESVLEECIATGIPQYRLNWHYRSRHESLITFSNYRYYDKQLITFPAAKTNESAVKLIKVEGIYSNQVNHIEAKAVVEKVVRILRDPMFTKTKQSIGIITLNLKQKELIEQLLEEQCKNHPEIEPYFQSDSLEPVVVKNLENMQGDERDIIILSIGYGPCEPNGTRMSMNFGPLNREGGWRRLNVALTRARQEMIVFSSFSPSLIDLSRTKAKGVMDLKLFLEFAERGIKALAEEVTGSLGGYDSPFEEAVARELKNKGWQVVPQVGVSNFRIDLGIIHPEKPGEYLVGIECDGATYHSSATARDRDKIRSDILKGLGWNLLRVWSTDWWIDKEGSLEKLHNSVMNILEQSRFVNIPKLNSLEEKQDVLLEQDTVTIKDGSS